MATHYVPFVTDFGGQHQAYSQWITDFGRGETSVSGQPVPPHAVEPVAAPVSAATGLDWGAVALGGAMGIVFALLVVTMVLVIRSRLRAGGAGAAA